MDCFWAICYHTNSSNPRATKWYYVARVVFVDGKLWALYRHKWCSPVPNNLKATYHAATDAGIVVANCVLKDAPSPHEGSEMVRTGSLFAPKPGMDWKPRPEMEAQA